MKITPALHRHNLYRLMRNQWKAARKLKVYQTKGLDVLKDHNLDVIDANEYVKTPKTFDFDFSSIVGLAPRPLPKDENHPLYKEQPCYMYGDSSVLLEGLHQALVLTNTVELEPDTLPKNISTLIDTLNFPNQKELVERCIKSSCLFDAEQKKLPVRKDPERPAWKFPRDFGITDSRKNMMLCNRLLLVCGQLAPDAAAGRVELQSAPFAAPLYYQDDLVQLRLRADVLITSKTPLAPVIDLSQADGLSLPELTISHPLISLEEENFYELEDVFPLYKESPCSTLHTMLVHYNETEVKNIYGTPVTTTQMMGRSLLKAYTAALAQARYSYGAEVCDIPTPVVVQCVQTDGRTFHFSVLQLNSADITSTRRNVYWSLPPLDLYEECSYVDGKPSLKGYNPSVFQHLLAFYINQ